MGVLGGGGYLAGDAVHALRRRVLSEIPYWHFPLGSQAAADAQAAALPFTCAAWEWDRPVSFAAWSAAAVWPEDSWDVIPEPSRLEW